MSGEYASWYEKQSTRDAKTRVQSLRLLGPERAVFEDVMALVLERLDAAASSGPITDLASRRKVALAIFGFDSILSAWEATLAGRYSSAVSLWRTIAETPQFLMALHANPQLANEMGRANTTIKIETIQKTIRKNLAKLDAKGGTTWIDVRAEMDKTLQPLAHVSTEAVGAALGIVMDGGDKVGLLRPGGVAAGLTLRPIAFYLADSAIDLCGAIIFALQDLPPMDDSWHSRSLGVREKALAILQGELDEVSTPRGDVRRIVLLKHAEDLSPEVT